MSPTSAPTVGFGGGSSPTLALAQMQELVKRAGGALEGISHPSHPHPRLQDPTAGLARIDAAGRPSPQAGLPGLAQLWPRGGPGRPPGRGQAAGRAAAQLLRGAGGALCRGGLSLPAHVVTLAPQRPPVMCPGSPSSSARAGKLLWELRGQREGKNCSVRAVQECREDTSPAAGSCHAHPRLCHRCRASWHGVAG